MPTPVLTLAANSEGPYFNEDNMGWLIPIVICPELGPKLVEHLSRNAIVFCTQIAALWS